MRINRRIIETTKRSYPEECERKGVAALLNTARMNEWLDLPGDHKQGSLPHPDVSTDECEEGEHDAAKKLIVIQGSYELET